MRWIVLLAALQQAVFPVVINPFREGTSRVQAEVPSQIEPAGYAFSIWSLIYLGALVYAVWQLTPAGRAHPATMKIAPLAIALYLGSSAWLWAADSGPLWATMPILAVMAVCAVASLVLAKRGHDTSAPRWLMVAPFALYAGWTACATFVNVAEVAPQFGFDRFGLSVVVYGALSIGAATLVAVLVLAASRGELLFAATVAWALIAILVAGFARDYGQPVMATAAVGLVIVGAAAFLVRRAPR